MKRREMAIGLAVLALAACSAPKRTPAPAGARVDASRAAADAGRPPTPDVSDDGSDVGVHVGPIADVALAPDTPLDLVADATEAGAVDGRPTRDATPVPDGPYRYPDPAGPLCGNTRHTLAKTTAQVMLVLDRSSSMTEPIIPPTSKWDDAKAAVEGAMAANPHIAWGLKLFPTGTPDIDNEGKECDVSATVEVPSGFGTPAAITAAMARSGPHDLSGTPTARALEVAAGSLKGSTLPLPRYLVLVTDGVPTCKDPNGPDSAIKALEAAAAAGLPTFVIGIWDSDIASIAMLDRMAVAGGKPRAGTRKYYAANNRGQLDASLAAITLAITNCVFPLAAPPLDANFVGVTVDGQLIARDPTHAEGWDYVMNGKGVEIFGSACADLKNGTAQSIGVHYGCPK